MMRKALFAVGLTALAVTSAPVTAQPVPNPMPDLLADVAEVEEKLVALANAITAEKYGWRPMEGVRSVAEVFMHVAADNYLLPASVGVSPPSATGIDPTKYPTVQAYETRTASRDAIIAALTASFAHLRRAMSETPVANLGTEVRFFGRQLTVQHVWIVTATHLHEHLGQAIAYARSNGVVPPWSR